ELAAKLGKAIAQDGIVARLKETQAKYEANTELQQAILEYNTQRAALEEAYKTPERDDEVVEAITQRIQSLYNRIVEDADYAGFVAAKEEMDRLLSDVNSEIAFQVFGERPCSHNCGSCGGGCSH
ncbi:MAG: YlbF family regulator, partial [Clostridiales bacterium]|nr:YlbF family regulator [Clostridiales bacterium]